MADKRVKSRHPETRQKSHFRSAAGKERMAEYYRKVLAQWPVFHRVHYIDTRFGKTHVISSGKEDSPPLVLFHGSASNSAMWLGSIKMLSSRYRVYAVDLPGEVGLSDDTRFDLKDNEPVEWFQDLLEALDISRVRILGCSLGGWLALKCGFSFPERIEKIALLTASGIVAPKASFLFKVLPRLFMGERGLKAINRIIWGNRPVPPEAEEFSFLVARHFQPRKSVPLFSDSELSRLTMPVLLIGGNRDALLNTEKSVRRLEKFLPCFESRILPNEGHVILDQETAILSFLATE